MQLPVRSLGGKLIIVATLILLVCLLLFTLITWSLLRLYAEHEAQANAQTHITLIKQAYQQQNAELFQQLTNVTKNTRVIATISQPDSGTQEGLQGILLPPFAQSHLTALTVVTRTHKVLAQLQSQETNQLGKEELLLINQSIQGSSEGLLTKTISVQGTNTNGQWQYLIALPILNTIGTPEGALLAEQPVDSYLGQLLMQHTGSNIALCVDGELATTAGFSFQELSRQAQNRSICAASSSQLNLGTHHYLTQSSPLTLNHQSSNSPLLSVVAIEPVDGINTQRPQQLLIIFGIGLFIFSLGVILYIFVIRTVFTYPMRQLQNDVSMLIASNNGIDLIEADGDELTILTRSFNLLSESLENESQAMTEQMSNLLIMSDALISTLNLEQLLGEIVTRLGTIMQVKHVALLLYGREMLSPWAVAHYAEQQSSGDVRIPLQAPITGAGKTLQEQVSVHIDPDGDITLAATTKIAAIPNNRGKASSSRQGLIPAIHRPIAGVRRSRIPRSVLRDLDMLLARIVIQKHKIAYGEDIATIVEERQENWTRLALNAGYRSVIAVPLLLQDQAIGAFILYADEPHSISSRDTFLLSTAAIQAAMAIQNALLFAEVKEKNSALEQANQLKSQFLANVTHELRTPLHSIISYGALILEGFVDGELTGEQEQHIQFMVRRAEDLSHLVDDMLDLSKIEADKIEVKVEPLHLEQSLNEVVEQLKPMSNNKELYLRLEIAPELPMVIADGHRLRQVVINLVSNALKFTEKGGVSIHCRIVREGEMVMVSVRDTGIGISPAALDYIFEAFRQADGSTTRRFGGTGLGLTIAKKLIELQGGEVTVESIPGQGSTFSFTLGIVSSEENGQ